MEKHSFSGLLYYYFRFSVLIFQLSKLLTYYTQVEAVKLVTSTKGLSIHWLIEPGKKPNNRQGTMKVYHLTTKIDRLREIAGGGN